jgi:glycosyltransferase involved in cell wall biosynthesis
MPELFLRTTSLSCPLVTVVIPTRKRPELVVRSARTALQQTYKNIEICVVIDGPDVATLNSLASISDSRLRVLTLSEPDGGSRTRNAGVQVARGEWIAFLDDDDEWHSEKLETQMRLACSSELAHPIISCRVNATTLEQTYVWPQRLPRRDEPLSEYLFVRSPGGTGLCITSTLLARRELLLKMPFAENLRRHQEWDWLLRTESLPTVGLLYAPETLVTWHIDDSRKRISNSNTIDWEYSRSWVRDRRHLMTKRAYSAFILTYVCPMAIESHATNAWLALIREGISSGAPRVSDFVFILIGILLPLNIRRAAASRIASFRRIIHRITLRVLRRKRLSQTVPLNA